MYNKINNPDFNKYLRRYLTDSLKIKKDTPENRKREYYIEKIYDRMNSMERGFIKGTALTNYVKKMYNKYNELLRQSEKYGISSKF